ncbi:MAG: DNA internalization-related competence protein ComEC/Rec2 [Phycisphaerales bacterium]
MDEIKEKIEEFKKSLEFQSPLKEIIFTCPAVLPAIGFICGLIIQFYCNPHVILWAPILLICIILYVVPSCQRRLNIFLVFSCFLCLGAIRLINFNMPPINDIRVIAKDCPTFAHIKAQIISKPIIVENNDWHFAKFFPSSTYTTFLANVLEIKTEKGWVKTRGKIKIYINEAVNSFIEGDKFQTFCSMDKFSEPGNPGQFNFRRYMQMNGVYLCASVKSSNAIVRYEKQTIKTGVGLKAKINSIAVSWLRENPEDENSRLIEALVLGSRSKIDRKLYNDFIKTGLVHLVCLSGLNVGVFAGAAWWLSKKAGLLHTGRSIICLIATIIFMLAVPSQSPILRAGIMFLIFCTAKMINQMSHGLNSLAISAIVLLLIKPMDILTPSFQLSFMAVAGLLLFYEQIRKLYRSLEVFPGVKWLFTPLTLGIAAWIGIAPIIAYHFYQVQLLSPILTVPASLPAAMLIIVGTFKIAVNPLLPSLGIIAGWILEFSAIVLSQMVTIFAKIPFSNIIIGRVSLYVIIVLYALIFAWRFLPFKNIRYRQYFYPSIMVCVFIPVVLFNKIEKTGNLQMAVLSVGHGQCCLLTAGSGKTFIIDSGSISKGDIGQRIVNPYLDYSAITKIDSMFISHDDIDHFNGLPEISAAHEIANIFTTRQLIASSSSTAMELKKLYDLKPAPEKITRENFIIEKLWPIDPNQEISDNESSLVLLAEFRGRKILFCSDITGPAQQALMNLYPQMDIDILITPHHGSQRTTDKNFIMFFKPEYIITSCDETQYGRIKSEMEKFEKSYFTSRDGALNVNIDFNGQIKITSQKTQGLDKK